MGSVQENIKAAEQAVRSVQEHCMCAKMERNRTHLLVLFPPGYGLDGVRVTTVNGVKWACEQALARMERTWKAAQL